MSETRPLYSVDSDGNASEIPPSGHGGDKTEQRAKTKARPTEAIPTDRLSMERADEALRTVAVLSRGGADEVTAEMMASSMGVTAATAPLGNAFFISLGLMEKVGRGAYKPTKAALDYQRAWSFDKKSAAAELADSFRGTWFHEAVTRQAELKGGEPISRDQLVQTFAGIAGTDGSYSTQYGYLIEWLEKVGLISVGNGMVTLVDGSRTDAVDNEGLPDRTPPAKENPGRQVPADRTKPPIKDEIITQRGDTIVSLSMAVCVTAEDLAKLDGDQIKSLFDGIGQVAAIRAVLNET